MGGDNFFFTLLRSIIITSGFCEEKIHTNLLAHLSCILNRLRKSQKFSQI